MIATLTGSNSFALKTHLEGLVLKYLETGSDFGLEKLDGDEHEYEQIYAAISNLPFLVDNKLVIIKNPSAVKEIADQPEKVFADIPESIDVILVETKLDKRKGLYKFLKSKTEYKEFNELDEARLADWVKQFAAKRGGQISRQVARYLVARVGTNQQNLFNELSKLLSYNKEITLENIDKLTEATLKSSIFDLVESAMTGDIRKSLKLYDEQRSAKVEPQYIIAMLGWQLHLMAIVKVSPGGNPANVAREFGLSPYAVIKAASLVKDISYKELKRMIGQLFHLELTSKSQTIDLDESLKNYIVGISSLSHQF
jgi:DNA polymerase III subunit delta